MDEVVPENLSYLLWMIFHEILKQWLKVFCQFDMFLIGIYMIG